MYMFPSFFPRHRKMKDPCTRPLSIAAFGDIGPSDLELLVRKMPLEIIFFGTQLCSNRR